MEPITTTIIFGIANVFFMSGFFVSGYLLGNYLIENTTYNDHRNLYLIKPRYNNLHNLVK